MVNHANGASFPLVVIVNHLRSLNGNSDPSPGSSGWATVGDRVRAKRLQQAEFACEAHGYTATKHQREVGTGYFDAVAMAISGGTSSTTAMSGSTEAAQFEAKPQRAVAAE